MDEIGCLRVVFSIARRYFKDTTVVWEDENSPKPPLPALVLGFSENTSAASPHVHVNSRGVSVRERVSMLKLRAAYLSGGEALIPAGQGEHVTHYNTARVKLSGFLEFLDSPFVGEVSRRHNITVLPKGAVTDTSKMLAGAAFDRRAECELEVHYVSRARDDETGLEESAEYIAIIEGEDIGTIRNS